MWTKGRVAAAAVGHLDPERWEGCAIAGDNKVYSAPIQSIKEKLWSRESCKLNRSTRLAFARSPHNLPVNINH